MTQQGHEIGTTNVIKFQFRSSKFYLVKQHQEADGEIGLIISVTVVVNS